MSFENVQQVSSLIVLLTKWGLVGSLCALDFTMWNSGRYNSLLHVALLRRLDSYNGLDAQTDQLARVSFDTTPSRARTAVHINCSHTG